MKEYIHALPPPQLYHAVCKWHQTYRDCRTVTTTQFGTFRIYKGTLLQYTEDIADPPSRQWLYGR